MMSSAPGRQPRRIGRRPVLHAIAGTALGLHPGVVAAGADTRRGLLVSGYLPWYRLKSWSAERCRLLTDLIYFGIEPAASGELPADPIDRETLQMLRGMREACGCRLHVCVGGGDRSAGFAPLAARESIRRTFVRQLCAFCRRAGFDGVDYDWEHPEGAAELAAYRELVVETRSRLGAGRMVSVAQSPWRDYGMALYAAVDRVHMMSYNHRYPHARLVDARADIRRMLEFGCPRDKLLLGVPFYGRNREGRSRTYSELVARGGFDAGRDLVEGFAFNGPETVRRKARLAREEGLAGVMVWEVGQDSPHAGQSLLGAIARELE